MKPPRVSVVTVVFNLVRAERVEYFRQCVDSVARQTHPDIEHLIIDGASTDGTLDILEEYKGKPGIRIISEPDSGIYDAMNKGLAAATGKYIAFLNSDDFWHDPRGLEHSVAYLETTQADFSYAPCRYLNPDGSLDNNYMPELGCACSSMPFCHQTMVTRVDSIRQAGGFADKEFRIAADYDLILNLLTHGAKPVFVPVNFTTFRLGGANEDSHTTNAESTKARERWIQRLVPMPVVELLENGYMPEYLYLVLASCLHPAAMRSVANAHTDRDADELRHLEGRWRMFSDILEATDSHKPTGWKYTGLLGLPLLHTVSKKRGKKLHLLFGFLPVAGSEYNSKASTSTWKLFGFIPFLSIAKRGPFSTKCYIFGIPFWSSRQTR